MLTKVVMLLPNQKLKPTAPAAWDGKPASSLKRYFLALREDSSHQDNSFPIYRLFCVLLICQFTFSVKNGNGDGGVLESLNGVVFGVRAGFGD